MFLMKIQQKLSEDVQSIAQNNQFIIVLLAKCIYMWLIMQYIIQLKVFVGLFSIKYIYRSYTISSLLLFDVTEKKFYRLSLLGKKCFLSLKNS